MDIQPDSCVHVVTLRTVTQSPSNLPELLFLIYKIIQTPSIASKAHTQFLIHYIQPLAIQGFVFEKPHVGFCVCVWGPALLTSPTVCSPMPFKVAKTLITSRARKLHTPEHQTHMVKTSRNSLRATPTTPVRPRPSPGSAGSPRRANRFPQSLPPPALHSIVVPVPPDHCVLRRPPLLSSPIQ